MPTIAAKDSNKNVTIAPHGTGKVVVGTGAADATLQSDGEHNLILQTGNSTTSKIEITDGANGDVAVTLNGTGNLTIDNIAISDNTITSTDDNGNIDLTPNGTGEVNISKVDIDSGAIDGTTIATSDVTVGTGKTLNVSAGALTTSTVQKQAIVDGASIEGTDILSTGESGGTKFLREDGDNSSSWQTVSAGDSLPSQTGNANKLLTTNASDASWTATHKMVADTDGIQRSDGTTVLTEDASNVATLKNVILDGVDIQSTSIFPDNMIIGYKYENYTADQTISVIAGAWNDTIVTLSYIPSSPGSKLLISVVVALSSATAMKGVGAMCKCVVDGYDTSYSPVADDGTYPTTRMSLHYITESDETNQGLAFMWEDTAKDTTNAHVFTVQCTCTGSNDVMVNRSGGTATMKSTSQILLWEIKK